MAAIRLRLLAVALALTSGCSAPMIEAISPDPAPRLSQVTIHGKHLYSVPVEFNGQRVGTVYTDGDDRRVLIVPLLDDGPVEVTARNSAGQSNVRQLNVQGGPSAAAEPEIRAVSYDLSVFVPLQENYESITVQGSNLFPGETAGALWPLTLGSLDPGPTSCYAIPVDRPEQKLACLGSVYSGMNTLRILFARGTLERGRAYFVEVKNSPIYGGQAGVTREPISIR
jgi:hypothetical protein